MMIMIWKNDMNTDLKIPRILCLCAGLLAALAGCRSYEPKPIDWAAEARRGATNEVVFANLDEVAWYYPKCSSSSYFTKVGQFRPNAWGLYDMHGNAWEWCLDRMTRANMSDATDPKGHTSENARVLRGGGCSHYEGSARHCRSARRWCISPDTKGDYNSGYDDYGFRLLVLPVAE